jgi:hypothetical protein
MKAAWLVARHGIPRLKRAIASGQYERPKGLFFGGREIQEGPQVYREYLMNQLGKAERVIAIDVHTGLGRRGYDTLLADPRQVSRLTGIFGDHVTPMDSARSVGYRVRGGLQEMLFGVFSHASVDFVGQEFGTRGPLHMLHVLREENRWHHYGTGDIGHPSKQALKDAFCPLEKSWREPVLRRGQEVLRQALQNLAA